MHDIKILEESWIKYRNNRRKPYYIAIFSLFALGGFLYYMNISHRFFSLLKDANISSLVQSKTLNHVVSKEEKPFLPNKPILTIQNVKHTAEEELLIPTIGHMDTPILPVIKDIPIIEETQSRKRVSPPKKEKKRKIIQHKKNHFKITKVSSKSAYQEVEKRFHQFHDVDDALFLARVYYHNGAYEKSELWALKTNKLNNRLEESWIIFAKSKIKLGRIDEAKHILSNYIKQSNSQKAKILLYKLSK